MIVGPSDAVNWSGKEGIREPEALGARKVPGAEGTDGYCIFAGVEKVLVDAGAGIAADGVVEG